MLKDAFVHLVVFGEEPAWSTVFALDCLLVFDRGRESPDGAAEALSDLTVGELGSVIHCEFKLVTKVFLV